MGSVSCVIAVDYKLASGKKAAAANGGQLWDSSVGKYPESLPERRMALHQIRRPG